MKKVLVLLVVFGLGLGAGRFVEKNAAVAEAGQGAGCAPLIVTGSGAVVQDMNGDGSFDPISEAIRLLNWAFLGGPAPVPPCAGAGPSGLPDTGQTKCYDAAGAEIPCGGATCPGQDGFYSGCPTDGRFTDNGDGTVTDQCTGLMWQKDTADINGGQIVNWCGALAFCENLSFAGHDDWRLPNIRELQSIVDHGRFGPAIDPVFDALLAFYWTSTSDAGFPDDALIVGFGDGNAIRGGKENGSRVRAVRGQP